MADDKKETKKESEVKEVKEETKELLESEKITKEIGDIVMEYGGLESNIPTNHKYWELLNRRRVVIQDEERKASNLARTGPGKPVGGGPEGKT